MYPVICFFGKPEQTKGKRMVEIPLWRKRRTACLPGRNGNTGSNILGRILESAADYRGYQPMTWFLSGKYLQTGKEPGLILIMYISCSFCNHCLNTDTQLRRICLTHTGNGSDHYTEA